MNDLHSNIKDSRAISPAAALTANGTTTSETIDKANYGSVEFIVLTGVTTDGQWVLKLFAGDASDMSDEAEVTAAAEILGTIPTLTASNDNVTRRFGYIGAKRYVRIKAIQSGATSGGFLAAVAIQGHPNVAPVA